MAIKTTTSLFLFKAVIIPVEIHKTIKLISKLAANVICQLVLKGSMENAVKTLLTHHAMITKEPVNTAVSPIGSICKSLVTPKAKAIAEDVKIIPNNILNNMLLPTSVSGRNNVVNTIEKAARPIETPVVICLM